MRADTAFRWAPWWVVAQVALWPLVGLAEGVLSLGAVCAIALLLWRRFQGGTQLLSLGAWALTTVLFAIYWLPELFSAIGGVNPERSLREALFDLRYLPYLWLVAIAVSTASGRAITFTGIGTVAAVWLLDALMQAVSGFSLGGASDPERLSGVFGAGNLKLGLVLASLAPFVLGPASTRLRTAGWLAAAAALVAVVLLAGARAAWLTLALVLVCTGARRFGRRRLAWIGGAGLLAVVLAAGVSERFDGRLARTAAVFSGDLSGLDYALSGRLPIWRAAWRMYRDNPVNGVGVRAFRDAYPLYAPAGDRWLRDGNEGAFHAHQIVLEILAETGTLGLAIWLAGLALARQAWRWSSAAARDRARLPGLALAVTVFPLNTHLAFYSTFWGGLTLLLAALYAGALMARDDD